MSTNSLDKIPQTFWAYFAGIFDGEGSIGLAKRERKYRSRTVTTNHRQFNLANMHRPTVEFIRSTCQMGRIQETKIKTSEIKLEESQIHNYLLSFNAKELRIILPKLEPYLIQKKERAQIMIEWLDTLSNDPHANNNPHLKRKREEIYQRFQIAQSKEKYWKPKGERTVWHIRKKKHKIGDSDLAKYQ
jgi:hypothetical protein